MLLFKPLPSTLLVHFVSSSVALFWFEEMPGPVLRAVVGAGRAFTVGARGAMVPLAERGPTGGAVADDGVLTLPLEPTVVQALVPGAGPLVVMILLARSA